jgi:hypothetical protein
MLAAGGARVPGPMVRNWDNAKGHFEATAAVRLSDRVLSLSGGSWMQAPTALHWDAEAEAERERLLAPIGGRPVLLKDPRMLLCWPFWGGGGTQLALIGCVRHPLAAARSMSAWRRLELADGLRLWLAHCRVLLELARSRAVPLVDVDAAPEAFLGRMRAIVADLPGALDAEAMAAHYDPRELHHDGSTDGAPDELLAQALAVHGELLALMPPAERRHGTAFPWPEVERIRGLLANGDLATAVGTASDLLATCPDPTAVLLPLSSDLLRAGAGRDLLTLVDAVTPPPAIAGLMRGKALLALGEARAAVEALTPVTEGPAPYWEARSLLAQALHAARRRSEARALLVAIAAEAVHPPSCLSTAAEWAWRDRDHAEARRLFGEAIAASPPHRRGRLRCRLAELLRESGLVAEAVAELTAACSEDPAYGRARELLLEAGGKPPILPPRTPE